MYQGQVKSFAPTKGYGFIQCDDLDGDVFFGRRNLPTELQANEVYTPASGFTLKDYTVSFDLVQTADGKNQAQNLVLSNDGGQPYIGIVKSWNAMKGFGFLVSSMIEGDVWFGKRGVPMELQNAPLKDATVSFSVSHTEDGKPRADNMVILSEGGMPPPPPMMHHMAPPMMRNQQMGGMGGLQMHPGARAAPRMQQPMMQRAPPMMMHRAPPMMMGMGGPGNVKEGDGMHGIVKSFNAEKGWGFIGAPGCPTDVYFKGEGGQWEAGANVSFTAHVTQDGKVQGRDVHEGLQEGQTMVGTVKSYNQAKGYGFLVVPNRAGDIYFKRDLVPPELLETNLQGMTVEFVVGMLPDGKPLVREGEFLTKSPPGYVAPAVQQKRAAPQAAPSNGFGGGHRPTQQSFAPPAKRQQVGRGLLAQVKQESNGGRGGGRQMTGTVKSYSGNKGFGFITSPSVMTDIYFKGQYPDMTGRQVSFTMRETPDGKAQAAGVYLL